MTITLNHTVVPTRDKKAAAQFFARIFGLRADPKGDHFAPVRINDTLTLLFDDDEEFESHHYAFHVSDAEFDAIFGRIQEAKLVYGSAPWSLDDGKLNDWNGGRGLFSRPGRPCARTHDRTAVSFTPLRYSDEVIEISLCSA
jgi:catechol 2,3-dioxygenase-like lactoylglutathione lyase family enzyme